MDGTFARRFPAHGMVVAKEPVSLILPVGSAMRERIILLASQLVAVSADQSAQRNTDGTPRQTAILKAMCTTLRSLPLAVVRPMLAHAVNYPIAAPSTADTWSNSFDLARNFDGRAGGRDDAGRATPAAESARSRLPRPGCELAPADAAAPSSIPHWLDDFPELDTPMSSHVAGSSAMIIAAEREAKEVLLCLDALLGDEQKRAATHVAHAEDENSYRTPDGKKRKADVLTASIAPPARDADGEHCGGGHHFDATLTMSDLEGMIGGIASSGNGYKAGAAPLYWPARASAEVFVTHAPAHDFEPDDWMAVLDSATTTGACGGCGNAEHADGRAMSTPPTFDGALLTI